MDLAALKASVRDNWRDFAQDRLQAARRLGVSSAYALIMAGAFLPLLQTYSSDQISTTVAFAMIASNVGANLVAEFIGKVFQPNLTLQQVEQAARSDPSVQAVMDHLIAATESIDIARGALGAQWSEFERELRAELENMHHSPVSLAILEGRYVISQTANARNAVVVNNFGTLNVYGDILRPPLSGRTPSAEQPEQNQGQQNDD